MELEDGQQYWFSTEDGSKLLVTAELAGDGEFDLYNLEFNVVIWGSKENMKKFNVTPHHTKG